MKFIIEDRIPFIKGVFEPFVDSVEYASTAEITHNRILDKDCIIILNDTRCNAALLDGTAVKMIASCSIGLDHIDKVWCDEHSINVQNSAGSNIGGISNYIFSALYGCAARKSIDLSGKTFGVIGNLESAHRVIETAAKLGFNTMHWAPSMDENKCTLEELLANSDIISMHLALNDQTRKFCNAEFFDRLKFGTFFINVSRGELVDESALMRAIPKLGPVILDRWENEPHINRNLLEMVDIATPHIAGYSYQSKLNATRYSVRHVARFFGISELYDFIPVPDIENMEAIHIDLVGMSQGQIASILQYNYPIFTDDFMLRMDPDTFTELRARYRFRREFYI